MCAPIHGLGVDSDKEVMMNLSFVLMQTPVFKGAN